VFLQEVRARDVLQQPLIAFSPDTPQGRALAAWQQDTGLPLRSHIEVRSGQLACALVASGAGVAVVDSFTAQALTDPRLQSRPVYGGPRFSVHAVRHRQASPSAIAHALVKQLKTDMKHALTQSGGSCR
jgi:DNA-binding transcriptional LysR family regulator